MSPFQVMSMAKHCDKSPKSMVLSFNEQVEPNIFRLVLNRTRPAIVQWKDETIPFHKIQSLGAGPFLIDYICHQLCTTRWHTICSQLWGLFAPAQQALVFILSALSLTATCMSLLYLL